MKHSDIISSISNISYTIIFVWEPSHKGIAQNEFADRATKQAGICFTIPNLTVHTQDVTIELKHDLDEKFARNWYKTPT